MTLAPCPICGRDPWGNYTPTGHVVECTERIGLPVHSVWIEKPNRREAESYWNELFKKDTRR